MTDANTLDKNRPFPDDVEVDRLLTLIEIDLDIRIHKVTAARRRARRIGWGAGGVAAFGVAALAVTAALTPIGSVFDPDGGGHVYLEVKCYSDVNAAAPTATYSSDHNDSAMQAQRLDPAGVCTQMSQHAAVERELIQIQSRADVQAAGSAVVYATDGSIWEIYRDNGGWSITGGPDPVPAVGHPKATANTPARPNVQSTTVIIRNFEFTFPPTTVQAVCVKNDVEFDVITTKANETPAVVCASRGEDPQK